MRERFFYILINLLITLILFISIYGVYFFTTTILDGNSKGVFFIIAFVTILDAFIINIIIKKFFHKPLIKLEYLIKSFIVGKLKNKEINLKETLNPNINYIFKFFSKTLNTLKNIKDEFMHGKEIKGEVALGKEIQSKMLDKKLISIPSLHVVAKSKPAGEIGGDSYDIIRQGDNFYIYVGDATGHGVGAGLIMMMVNSLVSGFSKVFISGAQILANTNEILKPRVKANLLMSLLLIRWNEKEKRLFMTGAGHEYLFIYKHKEKKCYRIKSGGLALGMLKDISKMLKEREVKFEKNDIIVLYSDGITEAINQPEKNGKEIMFGEDRLVEAIESTPEETGKEHKTAISVFNNITIELSKFMGYKYAQLDDVTLNVIQYKGKDSQESDGEYKKISKDFVTEWNWEN